MKQSSFSEAEFASKKKLTRRERFLTEIEAITPWPTLITALMPYYPKGEGRGRPPVGLERMLRMYIAQQCFGLSDEGMEDAIYESQSIRAFVGIDLTHESAPDATTLLKFRRLLEQHNLTRRIFDEINEHLASKGLVMCDGTIVEATLDETLTLGRPRRLIGDRAYDSDPLDQRLAQSGIEMISPHRRGRKKSPTQDGRKLRCYSRRWKIERTFAWLNKYRRVLTRWDHNHHHFTSFVHLACAMILLRRYLWNGF